MIAVEQFVSMPIRKPGGRAMRRLRYCGVVDQLEGVSDKGKLIDWKSAADIPRAIKKLTLAFQPELYVLACAEAGVRVTEIAYRFVARPTIKMCGKDDNDPAQYEDRCVDWLLEREDRMHTHCVPVTEPALEQARWYLYYSALRIRENRKSQRWLPNCEACFAWERQCPYLELCEFLKAGADPEWYIEENYHVTGNAHPELGDKGAVSDVLTWTSINTLHLCELRYWWRFERCLRRGGEDNEALWVGSAMHRGLEAYANKDMEAGLGAVDEWANENPVLGEDATHRLNQDTAKARAMVRAASTRWGVSPAKEPAPLTAGTGVEVG